MGKIGCAILFTFSCGLLQASERARIVTTFLYSHGYSSASYKARSYIDSQVIPSDTKLFDFDDAYFRLEPRRGYGVGVNVWHSSLGQDADIKRLADEINKHTEPVIPWGESRGAATIVNCLGGGHVQPERVAAAILDSPFDRVKSVLAHRLQLLGLRKVLSPETVDRAVPYFCWRYDPLGPQPIDNVSGIDHKIPVLLICSAEDIIVPYMCSVALYRKLVESGHKDVYLLPLVKGNHGWIMQGPQAQLYRKVVHAFYEKHGIEHRLEFSPGGHDILETYCQPTLDELDQPGGVKFLGFN